MSENLHIRMTPDAWQWFEARMNQWHLNKTEAFHKMISEFQQLEADKKTLEHDLNVYRDLVKDRPTKSQADKRRDDYQTKDCIRGLRFSIDQAIHFCGSCRKNHPTKYEACNKMAGT